MMGRNTGTKCIYARVYVGKCATQMQSYHIQRGDSGFSTLLVHIRVRRELSFSRRAPNSRSVHTKCFGYWVRKNLQPRWFPLSVYMYISSQYMMGRPRGAARVTTNLHLNISFSANNFCRLLERAAMRAGKSCCRRHVRLSIINN